MPNSVDIHSIISKIGFFGAGLLIFIAVFAPLISPHNPNEINIETILLLPNGEFRFGTDNLGRCVLSRVLHGTRTSLSIALAVVLISGVFGTFLGLIAAVATGFIRIVILKILDVLLIIPGLIFSLVIVGLLGTGTLNLIIALVVVSWIRFAKTAYTVTLSIKEREFVTASRAMGASTARIVFTHLLSNVLPAMLTLASLNLGHTILSIAALSFLGIGVQPPSPEWGTMLFNARAYFNIAPHLAIFPGVALFPAVIVFYLLGEAVRRKFDVKFSRVF
ncbi:MAG TPA: ABC transporter permease [Pyrinomonadaceae bacterium]|nr:ABC transporter permease [Pyrinomonadaceae bacterium]